MVRTVITGTGSYIPQVVQSNEAFTAEKFFGEDGSPYPNSMDVIIEKFRKITGIRERRYVPAQLNASDIAAEAGRAAIRDSGIDPETLDQVIIAHNFGDVNYNCGQSQNVPSLASRVKHALGIRNPGCIAYDVLFGCPGWVQGLIQSHAYFQAGMAKKILLVGAETLSRVIDSSDRDSMIFADGAGACVLEAREGEAGDAGIMGYSVRTDSMDEAFYISMGNSFRPANGSPSGLFIKMKGRKVYEYAVRYVPAAMKQCLEDSGIDISELKMVFLHQANEKMDDEILKRFFALYGISQPPAGVMPMSIQWLGNSSVATVPTLYDMVLRGEVEAHALRKSDVVLFASVGAGMNINAVCYRV